MKTPNESAELASLSKALGTELKRIRQERKESQIDVATAVDKSRTYISELESGLHNPSLNLLIAIANYYTIPLSEIIRCAEQNQTRINL